MKTHWTFIRNGFLAMALLSQAANIFAQPKPLKSTIMEEMKKLRESFDSLGQLYPNAPDVKVEHKNIDGIPVYWFTPKEAIAKRIVIYLHGGSYAYGSIRSHKSLITHVSTHLHAQILFIEYGLAPEHPFPDGLNDVIKVYLEILKSYPGYRIDFIGDSAGGGLAIATISQLIKQRLSLPDAVILISPWIDLACDNPSYEKNKTADPILTKDDLKKFAGIYTGSKAVDVVNPKNSDLTTFPPVLILVGSNEILLDDSRQFYDRVKKVQDRSVLSVYQNQNHVWLLSDIHTDAAQKALKQMAGFL